MWSKSGLVCFLWALSVACGKEQRRRLQAYGFYNRPPQQPPQGGNGYNGNALGGGQLQQTPPIGGYQGGMPQNNYGGTQNYYGGTSGNLQQPVAPPQPAPVQQPQAAAGGYGNGGGQQSQTQPTTPQGGAAGGGPTAANYGYYATPTAADASAAAPTYSQPVAPGLLDASAPSSANGMANPTTDTSAGTTPANPGDSSGQTPPEGAQDSSSAAATPTYATTPVAAPEAAPVLPPIYTAPVSPPVPAPVPAPVAAPVAPKVTTNPTALPTINFRDSSSSSSDDQPTPSGTSGFQPSPFNSGKPPTPKKKEAPYVPPNESDDPLNNENDSDIAAEWGDKTPQEIAQEEWEKISKDENVPIIAGVMGAVSLLFMLVVAQQMIENPDGCCASICRCMIGFVRCICWPCRAACCRLGSSRAKSRRTHDLVSTEADGYGYSHDLELT